MRLLCVSGAAGQERDAVELHANFTAAWRAFGWLPELFGLDLAQVGGGPGDTVTLTVM